MGIERRNHEAGARDRDNQVDLFRLEACAFQAFSRCFPAKLYCVFDVFVVGFRKRARLDGVIDREYFTSSRVMVCGGSAVAVAAIVGYIASPFTPGT